MKAKDREWAALSYLLAIIPLWGILFDGLIWIHHRESNRKVVFHAHQAIALHFILLIVFVFFSLFLIIIKIINVIDADVAQLFKLANYGLLLGFCLLYLVGCLWATFALLNGNENFEFPVIGPRLRKDYAED